jgi:hypothetical protein
LVLSIQIYDGGNDDVSERGVEMLKRRKAERGSLNKCSFPVLQKRGGIDSRSLSRELEKFWQVLFLASHESLGWKVNGSTVKFGYHAEKKVRCLLKGVGFIIHFIMGIAK